MTTSRGALAAVGWTLGVVMWMGPASAWAASFTSDVDVVLARANEISFSVSEMESETQPGAFLTNTEAITRFQDYLFLHLVGDHAPAAEGFFSLVTTGSLTDSGLHRDAEWYLAEALVGLENYQTAAQRFQAIVVVDSHPFRDDAVRRLLELYAAAGNREAFQDLYDREIVPGRVKPTGLITYSLAKSFYQQDDLENAKGYFREVGRDTEWYGRSRYFLGTIAVVEGDLPAAIGFFDQVVDLSIDSIDARKVHDLSLLALGRIHYHIQDYFQASEYYNRIGGDSTYQSDKLYEIIWTSIRRERWRDALNNVEIFLLAFPEHEYAAQLKLLQGHLNFQEENWTDALESYHQVIADYAPVQQRFSTLAEPESQAQAEVREVIEDVAGAADLPPYALAMMRNDPALGRAMDVFRDLERERQDIEVSERLVSDLRGFLQTSGSIGSYESLRVGAIEQQALVIRQLLDLVAAEAAWIRSSDPEARGLDGLDARRVAIEGDLAVTDGRAFDARSRLDAYERKVGQLRADADNIRRTADAAEAEIAALRQRLSLANPIAEGVRTTTLAEIDQLEAEIEIDRSRLQSIDQQLSTIAIPNILEIVDSSATDLVFDSVLALVDAYAARRPAGAEGLGDRIDEAETSLSDSYGRLGRIMETIDDVEETEIGRIRKRFEGEVDEVGRQRTDYNVTLQAARTVSLKLTRDGFGRLEDFFANSMLKADMGIVDVYWAQKLEVADELQRIREEKNTLLADLEKRFRLIREKMGDTQ